MGYADGYYYGQGRIRVDTSMFSVGDTIRVRSMTDSTKIYDKAVVTVGTPLIFTVPPYDTYKVCEVQEISDVVTEIGGVEVNIGFGDFVNTTPLDTNSLAYVQSVLNNHQENYLLNIGDEKTIKINDGGTPKDWVMQIAGINIYDSHEVILISKYVYGTSTWHTSTGTSYYAGGTARTSCQNFYSNIDNKDKGFIKQLLKSGRGSSYPSVTWQSFNDYVWIPNLREITGQATGNWGETVQDSSIPKTQFPIFTSSSNRIKSNTGGTTQIWWTCDGCEASGGLAYSISTSGAMSWFGVTGNYGLLPCFHLVADS